MSASWMENAMLRCGRGWAVTRQNFLTRPIFLKAIKTSIHRSSAWCIFRKLFLITNIADIRLTRYPTTINHFRQTFTVISWTHASVMHVNFKKILIWNHRDNTWVISWVCFFKIVSKILPTNQHGHCYYK